MGGGEEGGWECLLSSHMSVEEMGWGDLEGNAHTGRIYLRWFLLHDRMTWRKFRATLCARSCAFDGKIAKVVSRFCKQEEPQK